MEVRRVIVSAIHWRESAPAAKMVTMIGGMESGMRGGIAGLMVGLALIGARPAAAQVRTVDPNAAGSMAARGPVAAPPAQEPAPVAPEDNAGERTQNRTGSDRTQDRAQDRAAERNDDRGGDRSGEQQPRGTTPPPPASEAERAAREASANGTYQENDVLAAAEGVFGKGAEGLAKLIEKIFKDQGRPNA